MVTRFFYNGSSMACETFQYGGCLGNGNNFASEKECLQTCRTVGERGPLAADHAAAPALCSQQATRRVDGEQGRDMPGWDSRIGLLRSQEPHPGTGGCGPATGWGGLQVPGAGGARCSLGAGALVRAIRWGS